MTRDGRLGVGIVGAGRVGAVLGAALGGAGHAIVGASAVSERSRDRVDALLPGVPILDPPTVVERAELVLLAVPDTELEALVTGLAGAGAWQAGQLVVHTAPGVGTAVLAPAVAAGAIPLAIHPALAFTGTSVDLHRLREAWCAVTAPAPVLPIAQALVVEMGAEPVVVAESDRPAYAAALAATRELAEGVVASAAGTLRDIGVAGPEQLLGPLLRSAVEEALRRPEETATGWQADTIEQTRPEGDGPR
ncbi:MAG: DUF2520 domain-containing protein [Actinomycetales bacterium]|nr:DUF2520 domain-containing protein [Actinomycetales bacterium]